jgi:hypothetical protein
MEKEQIEKAAYDKFPIILVDDFNEPIYDENYNTRMAFIEGAEWALSQPTELINRLKKMAENDDVYNINDAIDLFEQYIQKPVESDAVEFAEWVIKETEYVWQHGNL